MIAAHSPMLTHTQTHKLRQSLANSPTALQPTPQTPKLPPVKFNALKVEACMDRKLVRHVTGQHLKQFELDTHSRTPRKQEQLGMSGMPS